MEEKSSVTLESIQRAALDEFPDRGSGFLPAANRQKRRCDGLGVLRVFFQALFASLVELHAAALMGRFMLAQTTFAQLPEPEQPEHMGLESSSGDFPRFFCPTS